MPIGPAGAAVTPGRVWNVEMITWLPGRARRRVGRRGRRRGARGQLCRHRRRRALHVVGPGLVPARPTVPAGNWTSVPLTVTGSPTWVIPNSHAELSVDMFTQPCDTLRTPWSPTDHGAAWMNSPPQVRRIA